MLTRVVTLMVRPSTRQRSPRQHGAEAGPTAQIFGFATVAEALGFTGAATVGRRQLQHVGRFVGCIASSRYRRRAVDVYGPLHRQKLPPGPPRVSRSTCTSGKPSVGHSDGFGALHEGKRPSRKKNPKLSGTCPEASSNSPGPVKFSEMGSRGLDGKGVVLK
jgi:hypothetical protein